MTGHYITLHHITLRYVTLQHSTAHYITLHCITLHSITLITLHDIALHCVTSHYITWHYIRYIRASSKSVKQECPARASSKRALSRVPAKRCCSLMTARVISTKKRQVLSFLRSFLCTLLYIKWLHSGSWVLSGLVHNQNLNQALNTLTIASHRSGFSMSSSSNPWLKPHISFHDRCRVGTVKYIRLPVWICQEGIGLTCQAWPTSWNFADWNVHGKDGMRCTSTSRSPAGTSKWRAGSIYQLEPADVPTGKAPTGIWCIFVARSVRCVMLHLLNIGKVHQGQNQTMLTCNRVV